MAFRCVNERCRSDLEIVAGRCWALWIAFFGYCFYVHANHEALVNQFGHLPMGIEMTIFGLANAAVFAGLLEMMMRERAGIPRPSYGPSNRQGSHRRGED